MTENKEKTVLITGAAGGVGRATVKLFNDKGWRVIGVDRKESMRVSRQMGFISGGYLKRCQLKPF